MLNIFPDPTNRTKNWVPSSSFSLIEAAVKWTMFKHWKKIHNKQTTTLTWRLFVDRHNAVIPTKSNYPLIESGQERRGLYIWNQQIGFGPFCRLSNCSLTSSSQDQRQPRWLPDSVNWHTLSVQNSVFPCLVSKWMVLASQLLQLWNTCWPSNLSPQNKAHIFNAYI